MARRTGVPSLVDVASELCRLVTKFSPVIASIYPTNTALLAAIAAAGAACETLRIELDKVRETGD